MNTKEQLIQNTNLLIQRLSRQFSDLTPVLKVIAGIIDRAIDRNFLKGGQWDGSGTDLFSGGEQHWTPLAKSTMERYGKLKYDLRPTLYRKKKLWSTIEVNAAPPYSIRIAANSPYARIHQYGGTIDINHPGGTPYVLIKSRQNRAKFIKLKTAKNREAKGQYVKYTKPHKIAVTIPPRPYITLTDDDLDKINEVMAKLVMNS
jgi:phage gpG-like protein